MHSVLVLGSIASTHSTRCNIKNKPHVIYITSKIQYYKIAYMHSSRLAYKYNTAEQQKKSFVASINSTGKVEYSIVTLQRNTYSSYIIPATPKVTARKRVSTLECTARSHERKIYNRPIIYMKGIYVEG